MEKVDNVNHPFHYADTCSLECWDVMDLAFGAYNHFYYCLQNAFKYLWRYKFKNEKEDVEKAYQYIYRAKNIFKREKKKDSIYFSDEDEEKFNRIYDMYLEADKVYSIVKGNDDNGRDGEVD